MEISGASHALTMRPGRSGQSVGHMAKAVVADAKAAGVELPKNAQGLAASAIAKGADPASVFAALVNPDPDEPSVSDIPAPVPDNTTGETPLPPATDDEPVAALPPADREEPPASSIPDEGPDGDGIPSIEAPDIALSDAETALALLQDTS